MASQAPNTVNPADVLAVVASLRQDGAPATFCFGTDEKPIFLSRTLIYAVKFGGDDDDGDDKDVWAVRVPLCDKSNVSPGFLAQMVSYEMKTLTRLGDAGFAWSPSLIGGDATCDNPIGRPYLVVSWIHGRPLTLEWTDESPAEPQRAEILRQLVDVQLELVKRTEETQPGKSTLTALTQAVDGLLYEVARGDETEIDLRSCLVHRALVRLAVHDALDSSRFALWHNNLAAHKIIVDEDYNIAGIIDWSLARFRPLQIALGFPRILGISVDQSEPSARLLDDRQHVVQYLKSIVSDGGGEEAKESHANTMLAVMSDANVKWRDLIIQACYSNPDHKAMADRSWLLDATTGDLAARLAGTSLDDMVKEEAASFLKTAPKDDGWDWEELLRKAQILK